MHAKSEASRHVHGHLNSHKFTDRTHTRKKEPQDTLANKSQGPQAVRAQGRKPPLDEEYKLLLADW